MPTPAAPWETRVEKKGGMVEEQKGEEKEKGKEKEATRLTTEPMTKRKRTNPEGRKRRPGPNP
jgi:hypothetical protein